MTSDPNDNTRACAARYNDHAAAYRECWAPTLRISGLRILRDLSATPARRVLEVGAGSGMLLPDVRESFPEAFILAGDRSSGMLAQAPPEYPRMVIDATRLAVATSSVDLTLFLFMLFHLEDPLDGLKEGFRVLRPGGRAGTATWGGDIDSEAERIWIECLDSHGADPPDASGPDPHEPVNTPEKLEGLLHAAGFGSARAWAEDLVYHFDTEHLISLKTRMGRQKARFDSLSETSRNACVVEARKRLNALPPEAFEARVEVVYAVGQKS